MSNIEQDGRKSAAEFGLRDYLWSRRLAKVLWAVCVGFWSGAAAGFYVQLIGEIYDNALCLLYPILFPPLVLLYLATGWVRQEIDAGRIILRPGPPPPKRSVSGFSDPMTDAYDARSPLYGQRIRKLHERHH